MMRARAPRPRSSAVVVVAGGMSVERRPLACPREARFVYSMRSPPRRDDGRELEKTRVAH